jgi:hypothetical protein
MVFCKQFQICIFGLKPSYMRLFILCSLLIFSASFFSVKNVSTPKITAPPGTVVLKDSLFIDRTEISNAAWKEFTDNWILGKEDDTALYKKMLPDSTVWLSLKMDGKRYMYEYFNGNNFNNYPVVGITYEQAVAFCEWRTERVNEMLERSNNATFRRVEFRLPTEAEWELAAQGKLDSAKYPYGQEPYIKMKGEEYKVFNCYYPEIDSASWTQGKVATVDYSQPNQYGISNMIANVAEMLAEKGLAKGGHYDMPLKYCTVKEKMAYDRPNRWLGFRCVCIVEKGFAAKQPQTGFKKEKEKPVKKGKQKGFVNEQ